MSQQSDLEAALELAKLTGGVALGYYREQLGSGALLVEDKADGSPVSIADRAAEQAARDWLSRRYAADGILGEELGLSNPNASRRWCIDPIDGTRSFLAGVPLWGSLVALVEGDVVLAGAAYFPATAEAIAAAPGLGLVVEGARGGVSNVDTIARSLVLTTDEHFPDALECVAPFRRLAGAARMARSWGDCFGYYLVATGRAELMTDGRLSPWDAACFQPIIEAAGGVFTDWEGKRTAFGRGVIATNRALAGAARNELGVVWEEAP